MNFQRQIDHLIAEMMLRGYSAEKIKDLFEDSLDNILSDVKDGENLGKYESQ